MTMNYDLAANPTPVFAGCSLTAPSDPKEASDPSSRATTLTAQDGNAPPCCAVDSAGVRITVVGGALTFHGPAGYRDTVFTPAGPMSGACVHAVPTAHSSTAAPTPLPSRQHAVPAAPMRSGRVCTDRDAPARPRGWLVHHGQHCGFFRDLQRKARYHRSRRLA